MRIDFQRLRHGRPAKTLRRLAYRCLVGRDGWPPTFRAPDGEDDLPATGSPHLYVHLPFCGSICPHCPYNKLPYDAELHRRYGVALIWELDAYLSRAGIPRVETLYFGGGTPTATPDLVEAVTRRLSDRLGPAAEVAVEVHPADADEEMLARLMGAGVNRISLGVETFEPRLLEFLGRRYTPEQAEAALSRALRAGFDCVDVNLIYAIPGQSPASAAGDAARCATLGVDQVSAYPLFTFVHTPHGLRSANGRLEIVDDRARARAWRLVSGACRRGGLERTSVWSHTRPGVAPYSTVTREEYVGFGAGAGSKVDGTFWFNTFDVAAYTASEPPRPALVMRTDARFRCFHWLYWQIYRTEIDAERYRGRFGRDLAQDFGGLLRLMRWTGFARREGGVWRLTERGAFWSHRLQSLFSLTYIDELWERCRAEAWPDEVILE